MATVITDKSIKPYRHKLTSGQAAKEYIQLRKDVEKAGILDRSYGYYFLTATADLCGFFFALYMLITQMNPIVVILSTVTMSFFTIRIGGLIHDAGHRAILKSTQLNDVFGYLFAAVIIFPFSLWKYKHNAHHSNTNIQGEDPDLDIPFVFTEDNYKNKKGIMKFFRKYQMWLYYPLGSFVSITYRVKGFMHYARHAQNPKILAEAIFMFFGMILWYVVPFIFFPFWKALAFFVIFNEMAGFYMLNIFAPNHKGMPQLAKNTTLSFLEQQIITSRNLYNHTFINYVYLGLNHQIEHHLFPNCPRNKLAKIRPYVQAICKKYNLDYIQMGIVESNAFILKELNTVARA